METIYVSDAYKLETPFNTLDLWWALKHGMDLKNFELCKPHPSFINDGQYSHTEEYLIIPPIKLIADMMKPSPRLENILKIVTSNFKADPAIIIWVPQPHPIIGHTIIALRFRSAQDRFYLDILGTRTHKSSVDSKILANKNVSKC